MAMLVLLLPSGTKGEEQPGHRVWDPKARSQGDSFRRLQWALDQSLPSYPFHYPTHNAVIMSLRMWSRRREEMSLKSRNRSKILDTCHFKTPSRAHSALAAGFQSGSKEQTDEKSYNASSLPHSLWFQAFWVHWAIPPWPAIHLQPHWSLPMVLPSLSPPGIQRQGQGLLLAAAHIWGRENTWAQVQGAGEAEQAEGSLPGAGSSRQSGSAFPRAGWVSCLFSPIANWLKLLKSLCNPIGPAKGAWLPGQCIFVLN